MLRVRSSNSYRDIWCYGFLCLGVLFNDAVSGKGYLCSVGDRWRNEYGAVVEWYWQGKTEVFGETPVSVPLCTPQIPHGLAWDRVWAFAVRGRWRTSSESWHGLSEVCLPLQSAVYAASLNSCIGNNLINWRVSLKNLRINNNNNIICGSTAGLFESRQTWCRCQPVQ